ncbi:hypothetical protein FISHEDRAFT_58098 [Fistulina hepatica ATCC 64428]|uniref:Uncharacterized protein n=1 Tax=Fistulina hepatica ATCC 64428 TaxID=1128425 RepID=A0A0D7AFE8_9AGAR|nr:hypothetical protein FISHEDRAFT_58098 [Fistulina hepatica ATCC 64428]
MSSYHLPLPNAAIAGDDASSTSATITGDIPRPKIPPQSKPVLPVPLAVRQPPSRSQSLPHDSTTPPRTTLPAIDFAKCSSTPSSHGARDPFTTKTPPQIDREREIFVAEMSPAVRGPMDPDLFIDTFLGNEDYPEKKKIHSLLRQISERKRKEDDHYPPVIEMFGALMPEFYTRSMSRKVANDCAPGHRFMDIVTATQMPSSSTKDPPILFSQTDLITEFKVSSSDDPFIDPQVGEHDPYTEEFGKKFGGHYKAAKAEQDDTAVGESCLTSTGSDEGGKARIPSLKCFIEIFRTHNMTTMIGPNGHGYLNDWDLSIIYATWLECKEPRRFTFTAKVDAKSGQVTGGTQKHTQISNVDGWLLQLDVEGCPAFNTWVYEVAQLIWQLWNCEQTRARRLPGFGTSAPEDIPKLSTHKAMSQLFMKLVQSLEADETQGARSFPPEKDRFLAAHSDKMSKAVKTGKKQAKWRKAETNSGSLLQRDAQKNRPPPLDSSRSTFKSASFHRNYPPDLDSNPFLPHSVPPESPPSSFASSSRKRNSGDEPHDSALPPKRARSNGRAPRAGPSRSREHAYCLSPVVSLLAPRVTSGFQ